MRKHPHRIRWRLSRLGLLARFHREQRGVAAIEFALILPILALLALGCFEVPRYVLLWQRLERASSGVSDLVAQADDPLTADQASDIMSAAKMLMQPYNIMRDGKIIITSVNNQTGGPGVNNTWQIYCGNLNTGTASHLGTANNPTTIGTTGLPTAISPTTDTEVLVTELFFKFTPVFKTYIYQSSTLYAVAYTRPRNHNLMTQLTTIICPSTS